MPRKQQKKTEDTSDYITETAPEFVSESDTGAKKVPIKKKRQSKKPSKVKNLQTSDADQSDMKNETCEDAEITEIDKENDDFSNVKNEESYDDENEEEEKSKTTNPLQTVNQSEQDDTWTRLNAQDLGFSDEEDNPENRVSPDVAADHIITKMSWCIDKDLEWIRNYKPAWNKLVYSKILFKRLKNLEIQRKFLDNGGLDIASQWIDRSVDGNYPCLTVVDTMLEIIDYLPIETEHLTKCNLGKIVRKIEKTSESKLIRDKCKHLTLKWSRMIFSLNVGYDPKGGYEDQYRTYRKKKIQEVKEICGEDTVIRSKDDNEHEDFEKWGIMRDRVKIPASNMFDFTFRPDHPEITNNHIKIEGTKNQILRKMSQMQKDFAKFSRRYGSSGQSSSESY